MKGGDQMIHFRKIVIGSSVLMSVLLSTTPAFAHVVVKPNAVGIGSEETFTVNVPNEKDTATVGLKVLIPSGLKEVTPDVKPGWTITVKKSGDGDAAPVTEIDWTDGTIPVGQRDEFNFSAQVPAKETTLIWKAYQTYDNGDIVSWDHKPGKNPDDDSMTPYSQTKIINDLTVSGTPAMDDTAEDRSLPISLSIVAVILAAAALILQIRKK